jgi:hypothetical protein
MKILDRFPMRDRGTGIVVAVDGAQPVAGDRVRRTTDGCEWEIEAVESARTVDGSLALCIVGDPPAIGDDLVICEP